MKALVVYESLFGNTAAISETIAAALRARGMEAVARPVNETAPAMTGDVDLLVVGGPTHVRSMSRPGTRKAGATDPKNTYAAPTLEPGLREWFEQLPDGDGRGAAAFDTRIDKPAWVTGSATKGIAKRLKGRGFRLVAQQASFLVTTTNTLVDGEMELLADLPVGATIGDQREDALLLRGEPRELLVPHQVLPLAESVQHGGRDRGVEQALPGSDGTDRADEVARPHLLEDVSGGAGHDRREERLVVRERREHEHFGVGMLRADLARGLDPAPIGQANVHHDDVGPGPVGLVDRLADRAGLGGDVDVLLRLKHRPDAVSDDLMVIDQHHAKGRLLLRGHRSRW